MNTITGKRKSEPDSTHFWIVVDSDGIVQARLEAVGRPTAERIAWAILPECEYGGRVIGWLKATGLQREAAKRALKINRRLCLQRGLDPIDLAVWQLREKFAGAGGGQ